MGDEGGKAAVTERKEKQADGDEKEKEEEGNVEGGKEAAKEGEESSRGEKTKEEALKEGSAVDVAGSGGEGAGFNEKKKAGAVPLKSTQEDKEGGDDEYEYDYYYDYDEDEEKDDGDNVEDKAQADDNAAAAAATDDDDDVKVKAQVDENAGDAKIPETDEHKMKAANEPREGSSDSAAEGGGSEGVGLVKLSYKKAPIIVNSSEMAKQELDAPAVGSVAEGASGTAKGASNDHNRDTADSVEGGEDGRTYEGMDAAPQVGKEIAEDVEEKGEAVPTTKDTGEVVAKQEDVEEDSSIKKGVGGDGGVAMGTENGSDDGQGSAVTSALDGKETASEGVTFEGVADGSQSADGKLASATGEGLLATGNVGVDDPMNKNNTTFNKVGSVLDADGWSADSEDSTVADSAATDNKAACKDDPAFLYKNKPGNTCAYIGSLKPERCSKLHNGAEIGVTSCPESCKMVEKCLAAASGGRDGVLEPAPAPIGMDLSSTVKGEEGDLTKKEIAGGGGVAMGTENTIEVGSGDDVATTLDGEETVSESVT